MKYERSGILGRFRGRRAVIPFLGVAVILFLGFGGHKAIVSFAADEVTGFLAGTDTGGDRPLLAQAVPAKPGAETKAESRAVVAPGKQPAAVAPAVVTLAALTPAAPGSESLIVAQSAGEDSTAVRRKMKVYTASFLRDPFYSLVQVGKDRPEKLLDVGQAKMVGSVWGESGIIALLEDDSGRSFALKVGDRVVNGKVISVTPASVTVSITAFDLTKNITLELAEEGE
jgi:hypothetical protein